MIEEKATKMLSRIGQNFETGSGAKFIPFERSMHGSAVNGSWLQV